MKKLLFALAAMPFVTGIASGADRLSDAQMARITAGALPDIVCPSCLSSSSMSATMSTNGVTQTTSTTGTAGGGSTGSGSTGSGSTGSGSTGSNSTPGTASRAATVVLPSIFIAGISGAAGFTPMAH